MKKLKFILFGLFLFILNNNLCYAEIFKVGEYIDNAYIKKEKGSLNHYLHSQFIYKDSDDNFVYCIDPFDKLSTEEEYDEHDNKFTRYSNLDDDTWDLVVAAAYFGYMYEDHTDPLWYSVTQLVIWRLVEPLADVYFTDRANGNKIHDYDDMIDELMDLIEAYYDTSELPSNEVLSLWGNKQIKLNDNYKLNKIDNHVAFNNGKLQLTANFIGTYNYSLYKGSEDNVILYTHDDHQNLIWVYDKPYVEKEFSFTSVGGRIKVKLNYENNYYLTCQEDTRTVYGIFDNNDNLIISIDGTGITSPMLNYGKYYVKQISHSCRYQEDDTKYEVDLEQASIDKVIDVKQKYKRLHLKHNICTKNKCVPEENVSFSFEPYQIDGYKKIEKTDSNGEIVINTGDSMYLINQLDGNTYYSYSNDVLIDLGSYEEDDIYITLNGYLNKADIKVYVTDVNNNPIDNAKVCLYNTELIDCKYSLNGELIFEEQFLGKYKIKEEEIDEKYLLNEEDFNIDVYDDVLLKIVNKEYVVTPPNQEENKPKDKKKKEVVKKVVTYKDVEVPKNVETINNPNTRDININFFSIIITFGIILLKRLTKLSK